MEERWKDVEGYEGYYQISNLGRVKSLPRDFMKSNGVIQHRRGRIKATSLDTDGYCMVGLSRDSKTIKKFVHRLVAEAFIDNPMQYSDVNHKDFDKTNNTVWNLEWMSHKDNIIYSIKAGRHVCTTDLSGNKNPNYGNHKLRNIYRNNKELSKEKQSRKRSQNGRAVPISIKNEDCNTTFRCISNCADYLIKKRYTTASVNSIVSNIVCALKNNKKYLGFSFERL